MPKQRATTTWLDLVIYAWTSYFILAIALGFPPIVALWLLFPAWHRRRVRAREVRRQQAYLVARRKQIIRGFS